MRRAGSSAGDAIPYETLRNFPAAISGRGTGSLFPRRCKGRPVKIKTGKNQKKLFLLQLDINAVFHSILIGNRLDRRNLGVLRLWLEEVPEPLLGFEIFHDGLPDYLLCLRDHAIHHLVVHPEAGLDGEFRDGHRLVALESPAGAAGCMDLHVGRPDRVDCLFHLLDQVVRVRNGCGRHVRGAVRCEDPGHILFRALVPKRLRTGRARGRARVVRGCAGPLDTGVHVGLVVVADVGDIVAAFERAADAEHPDIEGRAIAGDNDNLLFPALLLKRRLDPGGNRRGILEERVDPRDFPRGLGVRRGEDLHASRR